MECVDFLVKSNIKSNLYLFQESICSLNKIQLKNIAIEQENKDYDGYSFSLNKYHIQFRTAKVTPKKVGQFVTFYKRLPNGIIAPYDIADNIDFFIIASSKANSKGFFIFPKETLLKHDLISQNNSGGKRGFRVYLPNDLPQNKQANSTQKWQAEYYLDSNLSCQEWQYGNLLFTW